MGHVVVLAVFTVLGTLLHQCYMFQLLDDPKSQTTPFTNDADGLHNLNDFCPMTCEGSNITNNFIENSCCIECDCSHHCVAAGTCCIDAKSEHTAEYIQKADDLTGTCIETAIGDTRAKPGIIDVDAYMLIQICNTKAENTIGDDVVEKCLQPNENNLDELLPVYSYITNRNYRNMFCAICNGDSINTAAWNIIININDTNTMKVMNIFPRTAGLFTDTPFLHELRNDERFLLQMKPNNNQAVECIKQSKIISQCPINTLTTNNHLCEQGFYSPVKGMRGIYRNVFCLQCNEGQKNYHSICHSFIQSGFFDIGKFTMVLGPEPFNAYHRKQLDQTTVNCKNGRVYDNVTKRCLFKECAITEVKVGDDCLPLLQTVKGISLDYRLKAFYHIEKFVMPRKDRFLFDLRSSLQIPLLLTCAINILSIDIVWESVEVRVQLTQLQKIQDINIFDELRAVKKNIDAFNQKTNSAYSIELDTSAFEPISRSHVNFAVYSDYNSTDVCGPAIAFTPMQFCSMVLIKNFNIMENGVISIEDHGTFSPGEYIYSYAGNNASKNDRYNVYICYDLFSTRASNSSRTKNSVPNIKQDAGKLILITCLLFLQHIFFL